MLILIQRDSQYGIFMRGNFGGDKEREKRERGKGHSGPIFIVYPIFIGVQCPPLGVVDWHLDPEGGVGLGAEPVDLESDLHHVRAPGPGASSNPRPSPTENVGPGNTVPPPLARPS